MFHHVVMMRYSEAADAAFHDRVRHYVERIRTESKGLVSFDHGSNGADRGKDYPWAVIGVFKTEADHDAYQVSPAHVELRDYMTPVIEDMVVCDMTMEG